MVFLVSPKSIVTKGKLIAVVAVVVIMLLLVLANRKDSPPAGTSFGAKGAPDGFKVLPNEERIPTH